jgi:hypothetical protein
MAKAARCKRVTHVVNIGGSNPSRRTKMKQWHWTLAYTIITVAFILDTIVVILAHMGIVPIN